MLASGSILFLEDSMKFSRYTGFILGSLMLPTLFFFMNPAHVMADAGGSGGDGLVATEPYIPTQIVNCGTGDVMCTFDDLINMGNVIIRFSLYVLIIPLSIISFAFSGFRYLTAFGSESEASKAKGQVMLTIQGVFLAFFAWLLVSTFFNFFVNDTFNPFKSL